MEAGGSTGMYQSKVSDLSADRELGVKSTQLHLDRVKEDFVLKKKAAKLESDRALLQIQMELAEAQLWAEAEQKELNCKNSQCLSEIPQVSEQVMSSRDKVVHFLSRDMGFGQCNELLRFPW